MNVELERIPAGDVVVLQFVEADVKPEKQEMVEEKKQGVAMTPSVLFALLTIFTLAYSFYAAVKCVEAVQTPTVYTTKGLPVGKEF